MHLHHTHALPDLCLLMHHIDAGNNVNGQCYQNCNTFFVFWTLKYMSMSIIYDKVSIGTLPEYSKFSINFRLGESLSSNLVTLESTTLSAKFRILSFFLLITDWTYFNTLGMVSGTLMIIHWMDVHIKCQQRSHLGLFGRGVVLWQSVCSHLKGIPLTIWVRGARRKSRKKIGCASRGK